MIDFINEKILPECHDNDYWFSYGRYMMNDIIKLISKWRIGKSINIEMNPQVINGVLYMNGEHLGRIEPKAAKTVFDERSYYIEGKILARQEVY
jgi:pheromone shutdown protein TraB